MKKLVEIRTYLLKPGTQADFHAAMVEQALPMVRASGMDVVAFGTSSHEQDTYFLARAYADQASMVAQQNAFYNSDAWRQGPRALLVDRIDSYLNTLLWLSDAAIEDMRALNTPVARQ
jgi:NIPSNAP